MPNPDTIAYFTMEIGLDEAIPTYSGGLGMLAGDTVRSAADEGLPLVAVSLAHRKGYFRQHLDAAGTQTEEPVPWPIEQLLVPADARAVLEIEGRKVVIRAWRYDVKGAGAEQVPVFLLDTDLPENTGTETGKILTLDVPDEDKRDMLHRTAERVFGVKC